MKLDIVCNARNMRQNSSCFLFKFMDKYALGTYSASVSIQERNGAKSLPKC
jgi:hypothetical protein